MEAASVHTKAIWRTSVEKEATELLKDAAEAAILLQSQGSGRGGPRSSCYCAGLTDEDARKISDGSDRC